MFLNHYTVRKQCVHCSAIVADLKQHRDWHHASRTTPGRTDYAFRVETDPESLMSMVREAQTRTMRELGYF